MRGFVVVSLLLMTQSNLCLGETRAVSQESAGQRVGAMTKHTVERKVTRGFSFVENRYVSLPYRVGFDEKNVFINDTKCKSISSLRCFSFRFFLPPNKIPKLDPATD